MRDPAGRALPDGRSAGPAARVLVGFLVGLLPAVASAGCATRGDVAELRTSVNARLDSVRAGQDSLRAEMARVREALLAAEERQTGLTRTRTTELERRIEGLGEQLSQLTALTAQLRQWLREEIRQVARTPPSPPPGANEAGADTASADTVAGAAGVDSAEFSSADPGPLYQAGLQQFRRGAVETARQAFEEFLQRFPQHELAPDAQFYLAESYSEGGDANRALEEYARVLELYPDSPRAATALYRRGRILLERGNVEDARLAFERVIRGYPDSPEADLAQEQLQKIGNM